MKNILLLLWAGLLAAFCCTVGNSQTIYTNFLIYSNSFNPAGSAVTVNRTAPAYASTNWILGGTNTALWSVTFSNGVTGLTNSVDGTLLQNGTLGTNAGTALLPFRPQSGHIYDMNAQVSLPTNQQNWIAMGFTSTNFMTNNSGYTRFTDNPPAGYAWMYVQDKTTGLASAPSYLGRGTGSPLGTALTFNPTNASPTNGLYTLDVVLNTMNSKWSVATYVNGVQDGTNGTYSANPSLWFAGLGQSYLSQGVGPTNIQWNYWSLFTTWRPFITQEPISPSVSMSGLYTNAVVVTADTNGGSLFYQWYTNGVPLVNGGTVSGANTNLLSIYPVSTNNAGANISYYCVVTNNYGAATSSVGVLTVLLNPGVVAQIPNAYTNKLTLFAGTTISGTNYLGSSPNFQVVASGASPLAYYWQTNGVTVGGATNTSFSFTNCQATSPTIFACVVTNLYGSATSSWSVVYVPTPQSPYPQAVLASQPNDFWRMNETEIGSGDPNVICNDYQSGNNGLYTNTVLGRTGYNNSVEPTETAAQFSSSLYTYNSYAGQIQNVDFAVTNGGNAEFTVEAWVNSQSYNVGLPAVIQGTYGTSEAFNLGIDTNSSGPYFQFYVRNAAGTVYKADSTVSAGVGSWYHIVGVCDEANSNISLYVDGALAVSTAIPVKSGLYEASAPVSIGGQYKATIPNPQFVGYVDDVAAYNYALSSGQVVNHYASSGNTVPMAFGAPLPPSTFVYQAGQTITLPATVTGQGPLGYYWTDLTTSTALGSGVSGASGSLNAALTLPNVSAVMNGDQLELVATNAINSINLYVTLALQPTPVTLDYTSPIVYSNTFNGGAWSLAGTPMTAANALVGGTNTTWVDVLGVNDTGFLQANGVSATTAQDSWMVPFTPHSGYVYTLSAQVTFAGDPGSWVGFGFAQRVPTNAAVGYGRFTDSGTNAPQQGPNGYDWLIMTEASGNVQCFTGPNTTGPLTNQASFFSPGAGTHTAQVVLDTTGPQWVMSGSVDGSSLGPKTYGTNPPVGGLGITQTTQTTPGNIQWDYLTLTQVAPAGGVAPYTLATLPTNITMAADASLSIPATIFGDAPFGYYWSNSNTAAILGANATGTAAPLSADLSVGDVPISWNGNTLALVMTNSYGTNISYVTVTVTNTAIIPTNKPAITGFSITSGTNVTITATNGQTAGTYYLLGTTNLTTPLSQWLPVATNIITTNGSATYGFTFTGTNVVNAGKAQQFYILSNTN